MSSRSDRGTYRLNVRFLAWLLLGTVVICGGFFGLHHFQTKRLASSLVTQADLAAKENDPNREIAYLDQYIAMNPTSTPTRARLGLLLAKTYKLPTQGRRAYFMLQQVLADDPNIADADVIRERCVKLALNPSLGLQATDAVRELEEVMLVKEPNNPKFNEYYYLALLLCNEYKKAETKLEAYKARNPGDPDAYIRLAWLKRTHFNTSAKEAQYIVSKMFEQTSLRGDPKAWIRAATYYKYFQPTDFPNLRTGTVAALADTAYFEAVGTATRLLKDKPDTPRMVAAEIHLYQADCAMMKWRATLKEGEKPKTNADFEEGMRQLKQCMGRLEPLPPVDPMPEFGSEEITHLEMAAQTLRTITQHLTLAERFQEAEEYARKQVARFPEKASMLFIPMQLELLDVLVRQNKLAEAEELAAKLQKTRTSPAFVELQLGFIEAQREKPDWRKAIEHFDRCETEVANNGDLARRVKTVKIICLERTNRTDEIIAELRKAIPKNKLDPSWAPMMIGFAQSLAKLNRNEEAIRTFREIIDHDAANKTNLPEVKSKAVSRLMTLLMIVEKARGAKKFTSDAEIEAELNALPEDTDKTILLSRYDVVKGRTAAARERLDKAIERETDKILLYTTLFQLELQEKNAEGARAVMKRLEAKLPAAVEVKQMQLALASLPQTGTAAKTDDQIKAELLEVAKTLPSLAPAKRRELLRSLAANARMVRQYDLARGWLKNLLDEFGDHDLDVHYQRFDIALLTRNEAWIQEDLETIERVGGGKSQAAYRLAYAFKLLHDAGSLPDNEDNKQKRREILLRANEQLAGFEERKDWSRLYVARGKVNDMLERRGEALKNFIEAIRLGELHPELISRFIDLCYLEKKPKEFYEILVMKPEMRSLIGNDVEKVIDLLFTGNHPAEALEIAKAAVPDSVTDPKKLFWLARVQNESKDIAGAEATLRKVSQYTFGDGNMWLAYIQILMKNGKTDEAKKYIDETAAKLTVTDAPLYLAQAYSAVGGNEKAAELFKTLLSQKPKDLPVLVAASQFYFRVGKFETAFPLLEQLIKHPNATPNMQDLAKRMMALCVVSVPNHMNGLKALEILGFKSPDEAARFHDNETLDDLRCRFAVISVIKGRAARIASRDVLLKIESKEAKQTLPIPEERALGQIYYALSENDKAQRRLSGAVLNSKKDDLSTSLALYTSFLIQMKDYSEAESQLRKLLALEPNSQRCAELAARLMTATNRKAEAVKVMKAFAEESKRPDIAAAMLESLGYFDEAGPLFLKAAEMNEKTAEHRLMYAGWLARSGKAAEMMEEFEKAWDKVPPYLSLQLLCLAMQSVSDVSNPVVVSKAGDRFKAEVEKQPGFKPLLAAFKSLVGQEGEAAGLMREIVGSNPNDVFTLNNLAYLTAVKEQNYKEALLLVRKAQSLVGPQPNLLDTEAFILTLSGSHADAVEKLTEAIIDEPSATAYLHRAMAYFAMGNREKAKDDLKEAERLNLRLIDFHPLERKKLNELIQELRK